MHLTPTSPGIHPQENELETSFPKSVEEDLNMSNKILRISCNTFFNHKVNEFKKIYKALMYKAIDLFLIENYIPDHFEKKKL